LAGVYRVAGHDYRAARVGQSVLAGALVLAVYGMGASLFGRATGLLAAVGIAVYPPLIYLCGVFYVEHMTAVLLAMTLFFLVQWHRGRHCGWMWAAGITLGLTGLCRPVVLVFAPLAAVYVAWSAKGKARWRCAGILTVATVAVIAPWTIRNAMVFHHFLPVSTGFGVQLWLGNNDASQGDADDRHLFPLSDLWEQRLAEISDKARREAARAEGKRLFDGLAGLDGVAQDRLYAHEAMAWIQQHPLAVLRLGARRFVEFHSAFTRTLTRNEDVNRRNQVVASVSTYPVLAVGLAGAIIAWRRQRGARVIHAAIVSFTAAHVLLTACTRYRLPLDALWLLFASIAVTAAWEELCAARKSAV
jgi:4-amino-4-deoxy-L-arabinose transferase-like glycosyltransferase